MARGVNPASLPRRAEHTGDGGHQRLLHRLLRLEKAGKTAAGAHLRDLQVQGAKPRAERPVAIAIASGLAAFAALVAGFALLLPWKVKNSLILLD